MSTLERILDRYAPVAGADEFKQFTNFYKNENLNYISKWIEDTISSRNVQKSNEISSTFREWGNACFMRKNLTESINYFSNSLMCAEFNSIEYGKALANRSAAFHELEQYSYCLSDIELCLKSAYPQSLRPKVYVRMADCCRKLGLQELQDQFNEAETFIEQTGKTELIEKLKKIKNGPKLKFKRIKIVLPVVSNDTFLSASSKVELKYSEDLGRHVVAKADIKVGDVLFVEKAFCYTHVFDEAGECHVRNCYQCLVETSGFIPCKKCFICKYCSEECRDKSWENEHRFECRGMKLWPHVGITFAAFRCMFKGIRSGFSSEPIDAQECTKIFGDPNDNYAYFNSLNSNISKLENITPLLASAALMVMYLKKKTSFFDWISQQPNMNFHGLHPTHYIGGLLVRHSAQMSCNGSLITHYVSATDINNRPFLDSRYHCKSGSILNMYESFPIASAIYPSVSMMNHSCKPNISMYYLNDTVVVKAIEPIKKGGEVWNCYGVDYWTTKKPDRQLELQSQYHFTCKCRICVDSTKEYNHIFNYIVCMKCRHRMDTLEEKFVCPHCEHVFYKTEYVKDLNDFKDVLSSISTRKVKSALQKAEMNFSEYHDVMCPLYETLADLYYKNNKEGQYEHYKAKLFEFLLHTYGPYTKRFALAADMYDLTQLSGVKYDVREALKLYFPHDEIQLVEM